MAIPGPASLETRCVQSFKKSVSGLTHQSVIDVPHPHASLLGRDGSLGTLPSLAEAHQFSDTVLIQVLSNRFFPGLTLFV